MPLYFLLLYPLSIICCQYWVLLTHGLKKKKWPVWILHVELNWVVIHYPDCVLIITGTWLLSLTMLNMLLGSSLFLLIDMFDLRSWLALQHQFCLPANYFSMMDSPYSHSPSSGLGEIDKPSYHGQAIHPE